MALRSVHTKKHDLPTRASICALPLTIPIDEPRTESILGDPIRPCVAVDLAHGLGEVEDGLTGACALEEDLLVDIQALRMRRGKHTCRVSVISSWDNTKGPLWLPLWLADPFDLRLIILYTPQPHASAQHHPPW